jgi:hypothetical protein
MARPTLEAQLASFTQEFVAKLVDAIRNASFAEVAALSVPAVGLATGPSRASHAARASRAPLPSTHRERAPSSAPASHVTGSAGSQADTKNGRRARQTAAHRAELSDRVVAALRHASTPLGVRALSSELGVAPDMLAAPLRELRAAGRIRKLGEKRATTYST